MAMVAARAALVAREEAKKIEEAENRAKIALEKPGRLDEQQRERLIDDLKSSSSTKYIAYMSQGEPGAA